jgi:hypothetical protein
MAGDLKVTDELVSILHPERLTADLTTDAIMRRREETGLLLVATRQA